MTLESRMNYCVWDKSTDEQYLFVEDNNTDSSGFHMDNMSLVPGGPLDFDDNDEDISICVLRYCPPQKQSEIPFYLLVVLIMKLSITSKDCPLKIGILDLKIPKNITLTLMGSMTITYRQKYLNV